MSAVLAAATCVCGTVTDKPIQCPEHFHIFSGGRRLTSVGRIISTSFPLDPGIPADVLENARDRGDVVDKLFGAWLLGNLDRIPLGTREDAKALFDKLRRWFDAQSFTTVDVQVLLGCEDHGGVLDLRFDGLPVDLKATYDVLHTHRLQVAAYSAMCNSDDGAILHVTERIAQPRLVHLDQRDHDDWRTLRDCWRMIQRRTAK